MNSRNNNMDPTLCSEALKQANVMERDNTQMYEFLQTPFLSDVTIVTDDGEHTEAHKVILASKSIYFYSWFKNNKGDKMNLHHLDSDILKTILTYMYTYVLNVDDKNVEKLVMAANVFSLKNVIDLCLRYIKTKINLLNCMKFLRCAKRVPDNVMSNYCVTFIINNFRDIIASESGLKKLYEINVEDVVTIISSDTLGIDTEDEVFDFIVGWVKHKKTQRKQYISVLLNKVRLSLISEDKLRRIYEEPLLTENLSDVVEILKKMVDIYVYPNKNNSKRRIGSHRPNIILAIRSALLSDPTVPLVESMDIRRLKWEPANYIFCPPIKHSKLIASENGILLAIGGGSRSSDISNIVYKLDLTLKTKNWEPLPCMPTTRSNFAVSTQGNIICVIGGNDVNRKELKTIELYDTKNKIWLKGESMGTPRINCTAISHNNCLYVFGGRNGRTLLSSVECYDFQKGEWIQNLPSMPMALEGMAVTKGQNSIYIIGGCNDVNNFTASPCVYEFNVNNSTWSSLPDMNEPRVQASAVTIKNDLYVFGGKKRIKTPVFSNEMYVVQEKKWHAVRTANLNAGYSEQNHIFLNDIYL